MQPEFLVGFAILVISIVLHEVAHGHAANLLGDPTARLAGRLTLNPLKHIDPVGSVFIPVLLALSNSPLLFGYAKPVPYNPYNLKPRAWLPMSATEAFVAAAGPLTNLALALFAGFIIRISPGLGAPEPFIDAMSIAVYVNIFLALFNLIPIPPLDGSKVLTVLLPGKLAASYEELRGRLEGYGMFFGFALVLVVFYLFQPLFRTLASGLFSFFTGL